MISESTRYIGRAVVALASDPEVQDKGGRVFGTWNLAKEYGFADLDGTQPDWGTHALRKYGETKACDAQFYAYWESGVIDQMFPDWF